MIALAGSPCLFAPRSLARRLTVALSPMAQVVEINDPAELAGYRLLWTKLYSETAGASFFHSLDWLETYWRHHGDRQRLRVLLVYAAGARSAFCRWSCAARRHGWERSGC